MAKTVEELGADGIDLVQEEGCGTDNMSCGDQSSLQLFFLGELKRLMPNKTLTYTFPGDSGLINFPFRDVVQYGQQFVDTFNVYRARIPSPIVDQMEQEFHVPRSKIVWGLRIGCVNDNGVEDVGLNEAMEFANKVREVEK